MLLINKPLFLKFSPRSVVYVKSYKPEARKFTTSIECETIVVSSGLCTLIRHPEFTGAALMNPDSTTSSIILHMLYDRNLPLNNYEVYRGTGALLNSLAEAPQYYNESWTDKLFNPFEPNKMLTLEVVEKVEVFYQIGTVELNFDKELGFPHLGLSEDLSAVSVLLEASELISVNDLKKNGSEFFYVVKDELLFKLKEQLFKKTKNEVEIDSFNIIKVTLRFHLKKIDSFGINL